MDAAGRAQLLFAILLGMGVTGFLFLCVSASTCAGPLAVSGSVPVRRGAPAATDKGERCRDGTERGAAAPGRAGGDPAARAVVGRLNEACGRFLVRTTRTRSFLALCATSHRAVRRVGQPAHGQGALPRTRALRWLQTLSGPPSAQQLSLCSRNKQLAKIKAALQPRWAAASARP